MQCQLTELQTQIIQVNQSLLHFFQQLQEEKVKSKIHIIMSIFLKRDHTTKTIAIYI